MTVYEDACPNCNGDLENLEPFVDFIGDNALRSNRVHCPYCGTLVCWERFEVEHADGNMRWHYEWREAAP